MQRSTHQPLLECRKCRRLANQLKRLRESYPDYWNLPVPATGSAEAGILIVGLAPGLHGANRTGVPFAGDDSGKLLQKTLVELDLVGQVSITNAVKCLPIKNLPSSLEVKNCAKYLVYELERHLHNRNPVVFAMGGVAHRAIIAALALRQIDYPFSHGAVHLLSDMSLVSSYHCSRYNTHTGRLTPEMFKMALTKAKALSEGLLPGNSPHA